jgi:hypothetical protein
VQVRGTLLVHQLEKRINFCHQLLRKKLNFHFRTGIRNRSQTG